VRRDAHALVDGRDVADTHVLAPGERLEFVKYSGEKGASPVLELAGERAVWRRGGLPPVERGIADLLSRVAAAGQGRDRWRLYPEHVRLMVERQGGAVQGIVIEMPPGPRRVKWIAEKSRRNYGPGTRFEARELSFPFVVLVFVLIEGEPSNVQQVFFRNRPIEGFDDTLGLTCLLNTANGHRLESWICYVNFEQSLSGLGWGERVRALTEHLWNSGWSRSAEFHEGNSAFQHAGQIDPRLASVDAWEQATRRDPYFTLGITWPTASRPLGGMLDQMLDIVAPYEPIRSTEQLVTLLARER